MLFKDRFYIENTGIKMGSENEIVVIVDENNQVIGAEPRREMRALGLVHRAVYILVFNSVGELFCHKRTLEKDIYPGYFDVAAGGVVLAGESYNTAAERELEEELGIRDVSLTPLFDFFYKDALSRVWGRAFRCIHNGTLQLQKEEIESGRFCRVADILKSAETDTYTPDGLVVLNRYLKQVRHEFETGDSSNRLSKPFLTSGSDKS